MRSDGVVVLAPAGKFAARVGQADEDLFIQQLVTLPGHLGPPVYLLLSRWTNLMGEDQLSILHLMMLDSMQLQIAAVTWIIRSNADDPS